MVKKIMQVIGAGTPMKADGRPLTEREVLDSVLPKLLQHASGATEHWEIPEELASRLKQLTFQTHGPVHSAYRHFSAATHKAAKAPDAGRLQTFEELMSQKEAASERRTIAQSSEAGLPYAEISPGVDITLRFPEGRRDVTIWVPYRSGAVVEEDAPGEHRRQKIDAPASDQLDWNNIGIVIGDPRKTVEVVRLTDPFPQFRLDEKRDRQARALDGDVNACEVRDDLARRIQYAYDCSNRTPVELRDDGRRTRGIKQDTFTPVASLLAQKAVEPEVYHLMKKACLGPDGHFAARFFSTPAVMDYFGRIVYPEAGDRDVNRRLGLLRRMADFSEGDSNPLRGIFHLGPTWTDSLFRYPYVTDYLEALTDLRLTASLRTPEIMAKLGGMPVPLEMLQQMGDNVYVFMGSIGNFYKTPFAEELVRAHPDNPESLLSYARFFTESEYNESIRVRDFADLHLNPRDSLPYDTFLKQVSRIIDYEGLGGHDVILQNIPQDFFINLPPSEKMSIVGALSQAYAEPETRRSSQIPGQQPEERTQMEIVRNAVEFYRTKGRRYAEDGRLRFADVLALFDPENRGRLYNTPTDIWTVDVPPGSRYLDDTLEACLREDPAIVERAASMVREIRDREVLINVSTPQALNSDVELGRTLTGGELSAWCGFKSRFPAAARDEATRLQGQTSMGYVERITDPNEFVRYCAGLGGGLSVCCLHRDMVARGYVMPYGVARQVNRLLSDLGLPSLPNEKLLQLTRGYLEEVPQTHTADKFSMSWSPMRPSYAVNIQSDELLLISSPVLLAAHKAMTYGSTFGELLVGGPQNAVATAETVEKLRGLGEGQRNPETILSVLEADPVFRSHLLPRELFTVVCPAEGGEFERLQKEGFRVIRDPRKRHWWDGTPETVLEKIVPREQLDAGSVVTVPYVMLPVRRTAPAGVVHSRGTETDYFMYGPWKDIGMKEEDRASIRYGMDGPVISIPFDVAESLGSDVEVVRNEDGSVTLRRRKAA